MSKFESAVGKVDGYCRRHNSTIGQALKACKITGSRYYYAKRVIARQSTSLVPHTIELEGPESLQPSKIMVLIGHPSDIVQALRAM